MVKGCKNAIRMSYEINFGVDGWRGIIADAFTFENVKVVTRAVASYISRNYKNDLPVLIGYDSRFLANNFAKTCALELAQFGHNVLLSSDVVPTPVIAYAAANSRTSGAIQFTASHNPPTYLGLKYITNYGGPAPVKVTDEITKYIKASKSRADTDSLQKIELKINTFNPKEQYLSHVRKQVDFNLIKKANLRVVYDPIFGAGINYLDHLLKVTDCQTITIHDKKDPLFGNLLPDPQEEFLGDLKQTVKAHKAHIGLATDGDADRLSAVDQDGTFYSPNKIASMLLRHLFKNKKLRGKVVRTLSTTHLLDHLAKKYALELIETKVGFKWISEEMQKGNVLIGIEESGGISILNHIPDKDGILSGILLTEMLAFEKKTLKQIYKETLEDANWFCVNDRFDLSLDESQRDNLISTFKSGKIGQLCNLKVASVNTTEGAKYILDDGSWFMIRSSGTEPKVRVYFEATSDKILNIMKSAVQKIVEKVLNKNLCQK